MASSDEEGEIVPDSVEDYWFENDKAEFVSPFSMTLLWSVDEVNCESETKVFLRGTTDNGIQKIHKQVIGWRFELSCEKPEISVLLREKYWIALLKPRKCFESIIRSVLVTVSWLHFVKRNPEESKMFIWNKVLTEFSSFDIPPSENDVLSHMTLITEAANRDTDLTKSKYLLNFIGKTCSNEDSHEEVHTTKKSKFIVESEEEEEEEEDDKSEGEGELNVDGEQNIGYDTVCAICDNGGEILPCEGRCLRSFHATVEDGRDSLCESLGYTSTQVNAFPNFYCDNCRYKKHQCFACGRLGSSDESSPEVFPVFPCVTANCGHYYHLGCVARLLNPGADAEQEEMRQKIAIEKTFVCPLHICSLCRKGENRNVHDLQFAMCRRCPKAYHRKCLPKEISLVFDYYKGIEQRAWDNLLDKRILMYCLNHEIVPELGTPARNHLIFPDKDIRRKKISFKLLNTEKVAITSKKSFEELLLNKTLAQKLTLTERSVVQSGNSSNVMETICSKPDTHLSFQQPRKYLKVETMSASNRCLPNFDSKVPLKNNNLTCSPRLNEATSEQQRSVGRIEETSLKKPLVKNVKTSLEARKADMENRILALMEEATSKLNMEKFKKEQQVFNTSSSSAETVFHKNVTQGKVEGSIKAIQIALQKLDEGCSIEEAKAICEPEIVRQLFIWQKQLKVYLAPFLHGMRYTSYGRHFTKINKLKEIVDRLHWYVQNGDTVLDFCCGANDFSCLMKSKLEQTGKSSCSFKNYDLFQAKNDFNFEKRDWMSVRPEELPDGSQLIIGLNPPFGVKGFLANKFINKALTFKPKLLILIVPKVTKRLDRKKGGYDLIWEDEGICSGKSFYLPGSVDTRDKQMEDWNLKPPPLYLWSRPDWTRRHIEIAQLHCHIKHDARNNKVQEMTNYLMEENLDCYMEYPGLHAPGNFLSIFDGVPDDNGIPLEDGATGFP